MDNKNEAQAKANQELVEKTISDSVLARVAEFEKAKAIQLPDNYSVANALKFAYLILSQATDKDKRPVLQVCKPASIANALLEMVIQGLNPMKKQCYFIAMGDQLTMMRSYQGSIAVAKRFAGVVSVKANVVYEKDEFTYTVAKDGTKTLIAHNQLLENIDASKIRGAYAILVNKDGVAELEVMNKQQILKAWQMGSGGGATKAHTNFGDEMSLKTVINRACKRVIGSSDDAALFAEEKELTEDKIANAVQIEIKDQANTETITFEEVKDTKAVEQKPGETIQVTEVKEKEKVPATDGKVKEVVKTELDF